MQLCLSQQWYQAITISTIIDQQHPNFHKQVYYYSFIVWDGLNVDTKRRILQTTSDPGFKPGSFNDKTARRLTKEDHERIKELFTNVDLQKEAVQKPTKRSENKKLCSKQKALKSYGSSEEFSLQCFLKNLGSNNNRTLGHRCYNFDTRFSLTPNVRCVKYFLFLFAPLLVPLAHFTLPYPLSLGKSD